MRNGDGEEMREKERDTHLRLYFRPAPALDARNLREWGRKELRSDGERRCPGGKNLIENPLRKKPGLQARTTVSYRSRGDIPEKIVHRNEEYKYRKENQTDRGYYRT